MTKRAIVGAILAGGHARRMGGGDKGLILLDGRPILRRVLDQIAPGTSRIVLNVNGQTDRFRSLPWLDGMDLVPDASQDADSGPLAGLLAVMNWAEINAKDSSHILSVASDTPFLPTNLLDDLCQAAGDGSAIAAGPDGAGGWRRHPTIGVWSRRHMAELRDFLRVKGGRRVGQFADWVDTALVHFPMTSGIDPFFNINSPDDLARAEAAIRTAAP